MKTISKPVKAMTEAVPRSGSAMTSRTRGHEISRNGAKPRQKLRTSVPRLASQWARYTTSASLATSAGWTAGSGPIWRNRAEPPTTRLKRGDEDEDEQEDRQAIERDRHEPQPPVVDPGHDHQATRPSAPQTTCGPTTANELADPA